MPAIGNIAINDGKATPVTHTFTPVTTNGELGSLANRAASVARGYETLDVKVRKPTSATGAYAVDINLTLPVIAAVDGVDTVVRSSKFSGTFYLSQDGSTAERKDLRVMVSNALLNALVLATIDNLEPLY